MGQASDANFWIENASVEWEEEEAPFHTVARLTLLPKSQLGPELAEATYFDVTGHSRLTARRSEASIAPAAQAEVASRKARMSAAEGAIKTLTSSASLGSR